MMTLDVAFLVALGVLVGTGWILDAESRKPDSAGSEGSGGPAPSHEPAHAGTAGSFPADTVTTRVVSDLDAKEGPHA